jgi:hypothetical protein
LTAGVIKDRGIWHVRVSHTLMRVGQMKSQRMAAWREAVDEDLGEARLVGGAD